MTATSGPSANAQHYRPFVFHLLALACHGFGVQIVATSVGWQVYEITRDPFDLGLIGLSQFLPALALVLVTGLVADRFNRRFIAGLCLTLELIAAIGFLWFTFSKSTNVVWVFGLLALLGVARAFFNPASDALAPNLLSRKPFPMEFRSIP